MLALINQTVAGLVEIRQQWQDLLAPAGAGDTTPTRLVEVAAAVGDPGNLRMLIYVPPNLPAKAPLVVALHGCTQTAAAYDHGTGWSTLADEAGFAVLFPEQKRINHPSCCFDWYEPHDTERDRGEAMSIRLMIGRMLADHDLDPARVYITGLSAGGAMTSVMLATYPELFAGGAILAGLPYKTATGAREALGSMADGQIRTAPEWGDRVRSASGHAGPWPLVSVWHGDADTTVTPGNAEEIVKQWVDLHGLGMAPTLEEQVSGASHRVWRDANGRDAVEIYRVPGLAHAVPLQPGEGRGSYGAVGPFMADAGISSTWHIARFWGLTKPGRTRAPARLPVVSRVKDLATQLGGAVRGLAKRPAVVGPRR